MFETATAHRSWDETWKSEEGRERWLLPDADVRWRVRRVKARGGRRALDLGCGVGRHALYFARLGFETHAIDGSETGIALLRREAESAGLAIDARTGLMTALPYDDGVFDYVLAFNVIYHGDGEVVRAAIAEVSRVLKVGGLYQGTMLTKRHVNFGGGREVAPDTFVDEAAGGDKAHPHFYCDAAGLMALFQGFELLSLHARQREKPGTWHWHLVAERR